MPETPLLKEDPREIEGYKLLSRLGSGGMGVVFRAIPPFDPTPVALKTIRAELIADEASQLRFEREAQIARQVPRFCCARVIASSSQGPIPFIVTEFIEGPTLAERIVHEGPQVGSHLESLAVGIAAALSAIHKRGVVHRDLKPSNIILSSVGPRVIDFGLASLQGHVDDASHSGLLVGTRNFMAPEQFHTSDVTAAADVYAWGAIVVYAVTAQHLPISPTGKRNRDAYSEIVGAATERLGSVLASLLSHALAERFEDRPSSQALLERLLSLEASEVVLATAKRPQEPAADPDSLAQEALKALQSDKSTLAEFLARQGLNLDFRHAMCHVVAGLAGISLGKPSGIADLRLAFEIEPSDTFVRESFARALVANGRIGEAYAHFPEMPHVRTAHVDQLLSAPEPDYAAAYEADPTRLDVAIGYARSLLDQDGESIVRATSVIPPVSAEEDEQTVRLRSSLAEDLIVLLQQKMKRGDADVEHTVLTLRPDGLPLQAQVSLGEIARRAYTSSDRNLAGRVCALVGGSIVLLAIAISLFLGITPWVVYPVSGLLCIFLLPSVYFSWTPEVRSYRTKLKLLGRKRQSPALLAIFNRVKTGEILSDEIQSLYRVAYSLLGEEGRSISFENGRLVAKPPPPLRSELSELLKCEEKFIRLSQSFPLERESWGVLEEDSPLQVTARQYADVRSRICYRLYGRGGEESLRLYGSLAGELSSIWSRIEEYVRANYDDLALVRPFRERTLRDAGSAIDCLSSLQTLHNIANLAYNEGDQYELRSSSAPKVAAVRAVLNSISLNAADRGNMQAHKALAELDQLLEVLRCVDLLCDDFDGLGGTPNYLVRKVRYYQCNLA